MINVFYIKVSPVRPRPINKSTPPVKYNAAAITGDPGMVYLYLSTIKLLFLYGL